MCLYWLRRFRFARKSMGGTWIKTLYKGWIPYEEYWGLKENITWDTIALIEEKDGVVIWIKN